MGAYGTPDIYPYEEIERRCPKCRKISKGKFCCYCGASLTDAKPKKEFQRNGEKGYWSMLGMVTLFLSISVFAILFFLGGERELKDLMVSVFLGACVSAVGNLIGMVLCSISKTKNNHYKKFFLGSLALCVCSFILFGMSV